MELYIIPGLFTVLPFLTPFTLQLGITYNELAIMFAFEPVAAIVGPPVAGTILKLVAKHQNLFVCSCPQYLSI